MMKRNILLALILMIVIPISLQAVSTAGVIFLLIEPGSRSGAMGHAHVAQTDDAFAGWWNTGAMAFNRKTQFAGMHSNWFGNVFDDMYYEYLAWNQYYEDIGNIGVNLTYMTYGKQEQTDEQGNVLGTFTSFDAALGAAYGYQLNEDIGVGLNFKFIYSDLAPEGTGETEEGVKGRGMSFAFDFGFLYKDFLRVPNLTYGLNLQNVGPNITYINEAQSDPLPMNWKMGLAYRLIDKPYNRLSLSADMNKVLANDDPLFYRLISGWENLDEIVYNFGAEYVYLDIFSLRSGYVWDDIGEIVGFSFGAGIHYTFANRYKLGIDFAMQPAGGLQDYNQTFSAKLEF